MDGRDAIKKGLAIGLALFAMALWIKDLKAFEVQTFVDATWTLSAPQKSDPLGVIVVNGVSYGWAAAGTKYSIPTQPTLFLVPDEIFVGEFQ